MNIRLKTAMHFGVLTLFLIVTSSFNASPRCYKDLQIDFFNQQYIYEALDLYALDNIYQSQWVQIVRKLREEQKNVPQIIRLKANRMRPNPLEYPFQKDKAEELLVQTLYEIFARVMQDYVSLLPDQTIQNMFAYIKQQQAGRLEACLGGEHRQKSTWRPGTQLEKKTY